MVLPFPKSQQSLSIHYPPFLVLTNIFISGISHNHGSRMPGSPDLIHKSPASFSNLPRVYCTALAQNQNKSLAVTTDDRQAQPYPIPSITIQITITISYLIHTCLIHTIIIPIQSSKYCIHILSNDQMSSGQHLRNDTRNAHNI